jgi:hypothetical protein
MQDKATSSVAIASLSTRDIVLATENRTPIAFVDDGGRHWTIHIAPRDPPPSSTRDHVDIALELDSPCRVRIASKAGPTHGTNKDASADSGQTKNTEHPLDYRSWLTDSVLGIWCSPDENEARAERVLMRDAAVRQMDLWRIEAYRRVKHTLGDSWTDMWKAAREPLLDVGVPVLAALATNEFLWLLACHNQGIY